MMALRIRITATCLRETQPQVAVVHQEICSVFFWRDWVILRSPMTSVSVISAHNQILGERSSSR